MSKNHASTDRSRAIRSRLDEHVSRRLARALKKWEGKTDSLARQEMKKAHEKYRLDEILRKGRVCSSHIAVVTHLAKATHPDLKVKRVSNPNVRFRALPDRKEIGSHLLPDGHSLADTTGDGAHNAAAYELLLLLDLGFEGNTIAGWLLEEDTDALRAFAGEDATHEEALMIAKELTALLREKTTHPSTDHRAKQLYWLVGNDPTENAAYHLLAPLYATSLAHVVYGVIQDRFDEANKAARQARRDRRAHDGVFRDYPDLAVQKLGGTKPQNISQLNSERRGSNYLLSSAPPVWKSRQLRSPRRLPSILERIYGARQEVRDTVLAMRRFLESDPPANAETRNRVDAYLDTLIDELVQLAGEYQRGFPAGWSRDSDVELIEAERLWLDPLRAEIPEEADFRAQWLWQDWPTEIGRRFGNWLNAQLDGRLPMGDAELRKWKKELLVDEDEGGWAQRLHYLRKELHTPRHTSAKEGAA